MHTIRFYQNKDKEKVIKLLQLNIPTYFEQSEEKDFVDYLMSNRDYIY
jgi:hypothetical protein